MLPDGVLSLQIFLIKFKIEEEALNAYREQNG
jgi:hypothetical protein